VLVVVQPLHLCAVSAAVEAACMIHPCAASLVAASPVDAGW
jgi:hypothetical protein